MEEVEGSLGVDCVTAVEILNFGFVRQSELGIEPANFGVFMGHPAVAANAIVMSALDHEKAAVRSFDEALSREARRKKIRVIDARPPHTETGLADRPIAGRAPKMPTGLAPADVARTICDAIDGDVNDLPASAFAR
jgi:cyclic-di-GMP-binding biofilm dispersal mediator protein